MLTGNGERQATGPGLAVVLTAPMNAELAEVGLSHITSLLHPSSCYVLGLLMKKPTVIIPESLDLL